MSQRFTLTQPITHGLIIDRPWIDFILNGEKTWELRSSSCSKRGPIALIRKGSKQVVAIAELVDSYGPFEKEDLCRYQKYHQVPAERINHPDHKWFYAWKLTSITPLDQPVRYIHKNGSVIWAELDSEAQQNLFEVFRNEADQDSPAKPSSECDIQGGILLPVARDGTIFCPETCSRNGTYTVGDKGDEQRFSNFSEALAYLKDMPVARWRRPNEKGNWGIVSAVDWID